MNKTVQLIVVLAVLAGAVYFYMQRRVTFTPVSAVSSKMTIGKKAFGTQYDGAAEKDSPLVFFVPADRAGGFTLGRFEKASEGKQGYGIRFGNGDITVVPPQTVMFVDVNTQSCTNLKHGWDKKFLESKQDVGELLRPTGALD